MPKDFLPYEHVPQVIYVWPSYYLTMSLTKSRRYTSPPKNEGTKEKVRAALTYSMEVSGHSITASKE